MPEHGGGVIRYRIPTPVAELRTASPAVIESEHRNHVIALAHWFADIQDRTGRTVGTLLASEAREHRRRLAEIETLAKRRPIPETPAEALRRLEGI